MDFLAKFTSAMLGNKLGSKCQTIRQTQHLPGHSSFLQIQQPFRYCPLAAILQQKTGVIKFKNF